jgi:dienelactone hydrolase
VNEVRITVAGQTILGKLFRPEGESPGPGALFVHGWGASQRHDVGKAKRLALLGFTGLTFNLRGHARTRAQVATVSRADNFADLLAAYDVLAADPRVDARRIAVVGASYGGYLGTLLTAERPVRWLALQAPAIYKDGDFARPKRELNLDGQLPAYRRRRLAPRDNRVLAVAARFTGDVLIVQAGRDTVIPARVLANYATAFRRSAASVRHHVLRSADHGLSEDRWRRAYGALLARWLSVHAEAGRQPLATSASRSVLIKARE